MIINRVAAVKELSRTLKLRGHGHNPPTDNSGGLPRGLVSQLKGFCMEGLKIRNWDKWQSYRADRGQPPWIKIHRQVMRNPEWVSLTDAQRGQLVAIWLLAADHDGVIPTSPDVIKKLCYLDSIPDLKLFMDKGFIEHDDTLTSTWRQHDHPETDTETKAETEAETDCGTNVPLVETEISTIKVPIQKIVELYHQLLPQLPRCMKLTKKRIGYIQQRWREDMPELKNWENFFSHVSKSEFLTGKSRPINGHPVFRADIEWLCNPTNFTKIAEGKYHVRRG